MTMIDSGDPDYKNHTVATSDPEYSEYHEVNEPPPHQMADDSPLFSGLQQLEGRKLMWTTSAAGEGVPNHQERTRHLQEIFSAWLVPQKTNHSARSLYLHHSQNNSERIIKNPLAGRRSSPRAIVKRLGNSSRNPAPQAGGAARSSSSLLKMCSIDVIHQEKRCTFQTRRRQVSEYGRLAHACPDS